MVIVAEAGKRDVNTRTAQLVGLLTELGPDIPEIARRLEQFKESVRYRYKEKVLGRGLSVQGAVDHEKLGLKRVIIITDFAKEYSPYADSILAAMNELCYLVSFSKALPSGKYVVQLSVPAGIVEEVKEFFLSLKEKGMLTEVEAFDFEWFRLAPMKAECYDFDAGRWEFDWSNPRSGLFNSAKMLPSPRAKFDYVDLQIIEKLQMDANKSLKEISEETGLNYKKLAWHFSEHVKGRQLLQGYCIRWMGTGYDYKIDKALHKQHRYIALQLIVRDVSDYEMISLRQESNKVPFLWNEAIGRNYSAEFFFPVDFVVEGLQWISSLISGFRDRAQLLTIDQTAAIAFAIPYTLYDQKLKKWNFEPLELAQRFDNLILQIRGGID